MPKVCIVVQNCLRQGYLHDIVVVLWYMYRQFAHTRAHTSSAREHACTSHAVTPCHKQSVPEGALVALRVSGKENALQELKRNFLRHE